MTIDEIDALLMAKLRWAWDDGCPIAGSSDDYRAEVATFARRRWFSFERRHPHTPATRANRVDDLARAMSEKFSGFRNAGELADYRWLADQLAEVLFTETH